MKAFWSDNSYTILKMFINQIGMTFFGLVLSFATAENSTLLLASSIFSILFYCVLLYTMSWEDGAKDQVRIDAGRARAIPLKGLYMSFFANVVNLLCAAVSMIGYLCITDINVTNWASMMYAYGNTAARFLQGMYIGVLSWLAPNKPDPTLLFVIVLPAFLVCTLGYFAGTKNFRILKIFGIQSKPGKYN